MSRDSELENLLGKTEGEVFERATLKSIWKLMNNGFIDSFDFPISTGKEGTVFRARRKDEFIAVKIYRINTATFRSISKHLMYNPPKNMRKDRRSIIFAWAFREFTNLHKLHRAGVRVPRPLAREGNVIAMEYIGTEEQPAPLLKDAEIKNAEKLFNMIREYLRRMYCKARLIHSDLSSYNILVHKQEPVIIDVGQTVGTDHPMAMTFLERDIANISQFFRRFISVDEEEIKRYIIRCKNEVC
ncbi:MAG: serine protein kinase RIO [Thermoplasmata archaeon]|nr:MAG: serine protein kinase RIO [Thermoplasmata archaeon]